MMDEFRIPDKIGDPLVAWRAWRISMQAVDGKPELLLHSINQKQGDNPFAWHPRKIMVGICNKAEPDHLASETPFESCGCGIHALDSPLFLAKAGYVSFIGPNREEFIWGRISMWGKVIEGTTGIKSQYAYPKHFYIRPDLNLTYSTDKERVELDVWILRDILTQQWGIPTTVAKTLKRKDSKSNEVLIKEMEEPETGGDEDGNR